MLYYTGVGSRKSPPAILHMMGVLADHLRRSGWTLRSGGAEGADTAFEEGAQQAVDIYIPWTGFNGRRRGIVLPGDQTANRAWLIAKTIHPAWADLTPGARALHTRSVYQVLGNDLETPSTFLVCWTPCGAETEAQTSRITGGTRTAIALAHRAGVPIFNLARSDPLGLFLF